MKIPQVAAVTLHLNESTSDVVRELLTAVGAAIQQAVVAGAWRDFKLRLRFLACLQLLLDGEGVFPVLEQMFDRAVEMQTASSEDVSFAIV